MVNIVYSGVVSRFPELAKYKVEYNHHVAGVGAKVTRVVGKLVHVPVALGKPGENSNSFPVAFYKIDFGERYHFNVDYILSKQLTPQSTAKAPSRILCATFT